MQIQIQYQPLRCSVPVRFISGQKLCELQLDRINKRIRSINVELRKAII